MDAQDAGIRQWQLPSLGRGMQIHSNSAKVHVHRQDPDVLYEGKRVRAWINQLMTS
eukprot:CAMPEP_0172925004 /NCGR_PEP_ID=MMETSP1075-20121228/212843_1 /TAXON_ID=2916 /ORGANISM="Ceratium fusus, Strain PA161109" /LENGTH=55 /DNA_ID=CAMNT_0013785783 /DNA_START=45 /DNA_END=209 /DNA_ORIENTATION=-